MTAILVSKILPALILPPFGPMILGAIGAALIPINRGAARGLIISCLVLLYASSTDVVAKALYRPLFDAKPLSDLSRIEGAGAIVILGAGLYAQAPEYGADTLGSKGLMRTRYGAYLHRHSGVPILVTGGNSPTSIRRGATITEAEAMRRLLEDELSTPVRWVEGESLNTRENATRSYEILAADGIQKIVLVTHSYHMPRAAADFEQAGFEVVQAPTAFFETQTGISPIDFLPRAGAMARTSQSLREYFGRAWSAIRG